MKIKTYSQLQAARSRLTSLMGSGSLDFINEQVKDPKFSAELKALTTSIFEVEDAGIETTLKAAHDEIKTKNLAAKQLRETPPMNVKETFQNALKTKSVLLGSSDGSDLAIQEMISGEIVARTRQANGLIGQLNINPMASAKSYIVRDLTAAQVARYAETDGLIGFTRGDTVTGSIMKNYLSFSKLYNQVIVTDEAKNDVPNLVEFTLSELQKQYEEQYGNELVNGDESLEELPGIFTDYLDLGNSYAEALLGDDSRDANTFGAMASGNADALGTDLTALGIFNALVASLPAKLRASAVVTMNPSTVTAYQAFVDGNSRPLFDITPTTFQGYPLSLDDNFPELGDANKAVVTFGVVADAIAIGHVNLALKENPYQRDGATKFNYVGRVGVTVMDNLALRVLLAQA